MKKLCSSLTEYCEYYRDVTDEKAIGEVSPSYLYYSDVSEKIIQTLGKIKIVICLRNPIDRSYSNYLHKLRNGVETLAFKDALLEENNRRGMGWGDFWYYSGHSLYHDKVRKYISVFGQDNVHIVLTECMKENIQKELDSLYDFLNVDKSFVSDTKKIWNKSFNPKSIILFQQFINPSFLKSITKRILPLSLFNLIKKAAYALNSNARSTVKEKEFDFLHNIFNDDVKNLGKLMNHDFSFWLDKEKYYG